MHRPQPHMLLLGERRPGDLRLHVEDRGDDLAVEPPHRGLQLAEAITAIQSSKPCGVDASAASQIGATSSARTIARAGAPTADCINSER